MATSESTAHRVLEAASGVFLTHGYAAASMEQVRAAAGVSNGSLYHHFPTKAQLADALLAHTLRDFHGALIAVLRPRASAQACVKGLVRAYIDWVVAHPTGARLLHELRRQGELPDAASAWQQANAEAFQALRQWVAAREAAGEVRALPLAVWIAVVFAPAMALTPQWVAQPLPAVPARLRTALEHAAWMAVAP